MRVVLVASLGLLFACGNDGASTSDAAPADAPTLMGEKLSLTYPTFTVQPGQEATKCVWMRLPNATEVKVHQLHNVLGSSSHHLIVYRDNMDTTEQLTPIDCQPFTGALNTTGSIAPIMITQRADDALFLPEGVAYTFAANQMIKLEMHYLNATDEPVDATATVNFYLSDPSEIQHEADILFIGSPDINIGPMMPFHLKQFFKVPNYVDLSESNIFAITGHTHHFGTDVQVRVGASKTGPFTDVYKPQPFSWSEPITVTHKPEFSVPTGGGFEFECSYMNTSNDDVGFGESANDEMCFFWAYYYPSKGSKVCVHTEQVGGTNGLNVCCPGDPTLCDLIEDMF
jgi:hypothetical protein